jgi:hypothetical protein
MLGSPPPENNMRSYFWASLGASGVHIWVSRDHATRADIAARLGGQGRITRDDVAARLGDQPPIIAYDTDANGVLRFPETDEGWHLARLLCAQLTLAPHATVVAK